MGRLWQWRSFPTPMLLSRLVGPLFRTFYRALLTPQVEMLLHEPSGAVHAIATFNLARARAASDPIAVITIGLLGTRKRSLLWHSRTTKERCLGEVDANLDLFGENILFGLLLRRPTTRADRQPYLTRAIEAGDIEFVFEPTCGLSGFVVGRGVRVSWTTDRGARTDG